MRLQLRSAGLAAGLLTLAVAAPAVAAGPTVNVRVEGENGTLLERTKVTLSGDPVPGNSSCDGNSVGAALEAALGSNWDRAQGGYVTTLAGESHSFARLDYWAEWLDTGAGYKRGNGVCTDDVAEGNEVLMLVDMPPYGEGSTTEVPLSLRGVPAATQRGSEVTVTVVGAVTTSQYGDAGDGTDKPVAGATVSGGGATATTGTDGRATLRLDRNGEIVLKASKPGTVSSAAERVTVSDAPPAVAPPAPVARDTAAPAGRIRGIRDGQRFKRRKAPRTLRGSVSPDPAGLQAVKLSLTRASGGRCQLYSPTLERFRNSRCGRRVNFSIGDRQDWSYLLPERLGKGRYVLDVIAIDTLGNRDSITRGRNRVVFSVR